MRNNAFSVIEDFTNVPPQMKGAAVAIGNFDGMHRGHQNLFAQLIHHARTHGVPAVALTFEPHPRTLLQHHKPLLRLGTIADKIGIMRAIGLDGIAVLRFDAALAAITPAMFVSHILVQALKASFIMVGDNFHFGKDRSGDLTFLEHAGKTHGFGVRAVPLLIEEGQPVSSSRIRADLLAGNIRKARDLLGYHWFTRAHCALEQDGCLRVINTKMLPLRAGDYYIRGACGQWAFEGQLNHCPGSSRLRPNWIDAGAVTFAQNVSFALVERLDSSSTVQSAYSLSPIDLQLGIL